MPRSPLRSGTGVALNAVALVALVGAYFARDDVMVEGAYFNRAVGSDDVQVVVTGDSVTDWLVASALLLTAGTSILVREIREARSTAG